MFQTLHSLSLSGSTWTGGFVLLSSGAGTEARALQMRELGTASEPQSSCLVSIWFLLFVF